MAQINKPSEYFNTVLWTGNGTDDRSITGVGFKPDWVWYKERSNVGDHTVHDVVRGAGERLFPNDTAAESLDANSLQAFETDGFQIGTNTDVNGNGETYVGWNWLADNTTGSSNTDGSITSTVSANTTSGFSIVSYIGNGADNDTATIGHGLGVAPNMIMIKCRNAAGGWQTSSTSLGWNNVLQLNLTNAQASGTYAFGVSGVTPNTNTFTVSATSGGNHTNTNNNNYIAYCFAEKKGFSKFGSYTGNGNADGPFIYTGFKPAFVVMKRTDTTGHWLLFDNKRSSSNGFNLIQQYLYPNLSDSESSDLTRGMDFLSNGFKHRNNFSAINASGGSYIYMCFSENPLVGTNNIPATAR